MPPIRYFLIAYDRHRGILLEEPRDFDDEAAAVDAYASAERDHAGDRNIEIVLVGADSLETIKTTHSNYFSNGLVDALSKALERQPA
jgi:hypothetical protein